MLSFKTYVKLNSVGGKDKSKNERTVFRGRLSTVVVIAVEEIVVILVEGVVVVVVILIIATAMVIMESKMEKLERLGNDEKSENTFQE